jgi:hypothetical protein
MDVSDILISEIIKFDQEKDSYQLQETEFYQIYTMVEDGQINSVCRLNIDKEINFSEYFYENIKRFVRSYLKKRGKEKSIVESIKDQRAAILVEYFISRFFETEVRINKEWKDLQYPQLKFKEDFNVFDAVFLTDLNDREKSLVVYFNFSLEDDQRLVNKSYEVLEKRLRLKIIKRLLYLKHHPDFNQIVAFVLEYLLIFIREKIKLYKYYYEASPDNYLTYTTVFNSRVEEVLKDNNPDFSMTIDFYDEIEDTIPEEEDPLDPEARNELWIWIKNNLDEQDLFLFELYDKYKEHRSRKKDKIDLHENKILTWRDIAREFNEKYSKDDPKKINVGALKMRFGKIIQRIKDLNSKKNKPKVKNKRSEKKNKRRCFKNAFKKMNRIIKDLNPKNKRPGSKNKRSEKNKRRPSS